MKLLVVCLFLMPLCSYAETHLILHIASEHSDGTYDSVDGSIKQYNERNLGLGVAYAITNNTQVRVGFYDNSLSNMSLYLSGSLHTNINRLLALGAQIGIVSGYMDEYEGVRTTGLIPMALPFVQLRHKRIAVEVGYVPPIIGRQTSLTTLSVTLRL